MDNFCQIVGAIKNGANQTIAMIVTTTPIPEIHAAIQAKPVRPVYVTAIPVLPGVCEPAVVQAES